MTTPVYKEFAEVYARHWEQYTKLILPWFPAILENFEQKPRSILDLACGTGQFAIGVAKQGFTVVGVDRSAEMLKIARGRSRRVKVSVVWAEQDMRHLRWNEPVDMVTCWFDSLNYLVEPGEVQQTFRAVFDVLSPGGGFLFDVNTIRGLSERWNTGTSIAVDTPDCFVVTDTEYSAKDNTNRLVLHGFVGKPGGFKRIHEVHLQRAYRIEDLTTWLKEAGFAQVEVFGMKDYDPGTEELYRVFVLARRMR